MIYMPNNLPQEFEIIETDRNPVACDGGGGPLGHPRVWLPIELHSESVTCPYCSRTYVHAHAA